MKSLIPKYGKGSSLNIERTESKSTANKNYVQSKENFSKKSSNKPKPGLVTKHQTTSTLEVNDGLKTKELAVAPIKKPVGGLKPRPLVDLSQYYNPGNTKMLKPKKVKKAADIIEDEEPRQSPNWGKARQYAPLLANVAGNTLQYLMSKPKLIGVIKPKEILNSSRVAVAQVAPVKSLFRENFDTAAGKVRPAYRGSDPIMAAMAGNQQQATLGNIRLQKSAAEGEYRNAQQAALIQAENLANQGNVANLNSDTATLNANNAQNLQYQQAQLAARKKYEEENSARKIGFVNSLTGAIGGHIQQREQLRTTKDLTDLAGLKEKETANRLARQYAYLYGKEGTDLTPYDTNVTNSEKAYNDANESFKKRYGLG
jgi:hypothetical protein